MRELSRYYLGRKDARRAAVAGELEVTDIENLLEKAQQLKGRENGIRWELAEIAYEIVGSPLGRMGATRQLADVCGLSAVDAVEHWAKAWRLYRVIRFMADVADLYRDEFSVSHFYKMWDLGHRYKIPIKKIIKYFGTLLAHKEIGDKWSVSVLEMLVDADYGTGNPVNWRYHWTRIDKPMTALGSFPDIDPVLRAFVKVYNGVKERIK